VKSPVVDVNVEQVVDIPQVLVRVDADAASHHGLSAGEAAAAIGTALWGKTAGHVYAEGTLTEVVVKYAAEVLNDIASVRRARILTPSGALVPLSALADVRRDSGPNYVLRENVERRVVVTANVHGRDMRGAYEAVRAAIEQSLPLPAGVRIEYAGQFEREEATARRLLLLGLLAIAGIVLIVATTLGRARRTLIVLVNLPLALAGGVIGVYIAGGELSVATTIGFHHALRHRHAQRHPARDPNSRPGGGGARARRGGRKIRP
jgi:Cu/Ag efflux pump CusA